MGFWAHGASESRAHRLITPSLPIVAQDRVVELEVVGDVLDPVGVLVVAGPDVVLVVDPLLVQDLVQLRHLCLKLLTNVIDMEKEEAVK